MISHVKSFLIPYKRGTPEEGHKTQRQKRFVKTNNNKDEDNCPKNNTLNIAPDFTFKG